jgi:glutamyl-tRNA reductase
MQGCRSQVVPTIAALRAQAAEIHDAEVARALARLGHLSEADAFVIRAMAQRIVGTLLQRPMTALRADAEGANMAHVLQRLFGLEPMAETPPAARPGHAE